MIIAGAGGAAHLPGMVAAQTLLPVLGVPVQSQALNGLDSLLSIVQMPAGVPGRRRWRSARPGRPTRRCWPSAFLARTRPRAARRSSSEFVEEQTAQRASREAAMS